MKTNTCLMRRFERLTALVESTVAESVPNLHFASQPFEAEQICEAGKNFVFAMQDAIEVLQSEGGDA